MLIDIYLKVMRVIISYNNYYKIQDVFIHSQVFIWKTLFWVLEEYIDTSISVSIYI